MLEINKIHQGDCLELLKEINDNSVDFILTDPPFNVGIDYDGSDDNLKDEEYYKWCKEWVSLLFHTLKRGSYCVIFSGDKKLFFLFKAINESGFLFHHFLKWHKPNAQRGLSGTVFFNRTELAFVLSKGKPDLKNINRKVMFSDTIICKNTKPNDKFKSVEHNCRRPEKLYRQIIEGMSGGSLVLDCFMGSGTTAVACKSLGKSFIGIELNPKYVKIANKKLQQEVLSNLSPPVQTSKSEILTFSKAERDLICFKEEFQK